MWSILSSRTHTLTLGEGRDFYCILFYVFFVASFLFSSSACVFHETGNTGSCFKICVCVFFYVLVSELSCAASTGFLRGSPSCSNGDSCPEMGKLNIEVKQK